MQQTRTTEDYKGEDSGAGAEWGGGVILTNKRFGMTMASKLRTVQATCNTIPQTFAECA